MFGSKLLPIFFLISTLMVTVFSQEGRTDLRSESVSKSIEIRSTIDLDRFSRFVGGKRNENKTNIGSKRLVTEINRAREELETQNRKPIFVSPIARRNKLKRPYFVERVSYSNENFEILNKGIQAKGDSLSVELTPLFRSGLVLTAKAGYFSSERDDFDLAPEYERTRISRIQAIDLKADYNSDRIELSVGTNTLSQGSGTEYIESNGEFELGDRTTDLSGDLSIRYKATSKFEVYGMFSRTKSAGIEGEPESYLDLDPDHVAEIGMQITDLAGFDVEGVWIHQSRSVLDKNEEGITRAFGSFDLSVGKTFMKRIDVGLDIENVFGIESFESVGLYNSRFPANSFASRTYFENVAQSRRFTISVGINFL